MGGKTLSLLVAVAVASAGCSSIFYRAGQAPIIGDPAHGTPTHIIVNNREGQTFRVRRTQISGVRMGGMRTALWSLLSGYAALILVPVGLLQWASESSTMDASDGPATATEVADDEEVDVNAAVAR